jgi:septal ring factor EnvC (AmiA/AmiB activator)
MADPVGTIPWILTALGGAVSALFGYLNKEKAERITDLKADKTGIKADGDAKLEAEKKEREREKAELQAVIKALGEKLDATREKLESERRTVATLLVHSRRVPEQPEAWEAEMPSQVQALAQVAPTLESRRALDERALQRYTQGKDPYASSDPPPIPEPPPVPQMRKRTPSRSDR